MANENETVADIKSEMYGIVADEFGYVTLAQSDLIGIADRIDDAHKREVAELRECLREAVYNECNYCRTVRKDGTYGRCEHLRDDGGCDHLRGVKCIVHKWRKVLDACGLAGGEK